MKGDITEIIRHRVYERDKERLNLPEYEELWKKKDKACMKQKHTEKYHSDKANAEYYLAKGLMLAFNSGLINFNMVKWVLKSVARSKANQALSDSLK